MSSSSDMTPIGKLILEDFWKGFQAFLDQQAWRELRLCVSIVSVTGRTEMLTICI